MIRELAEFVGASEDAVINWEIRGGRPLKRFQDSLREILGVQMKL
jgi:hypothetical protein